MLNYDRCMLCNCCCCQSITYHTIALQNENPFEAKLKVSLNSLNLPTILHFLLFHSNSKYFRHLYNRSYLHHNPDLFHFLVVAYMFRDPILIITPNHCHFIIFKSYHACCQYEITKPLCDLHIPFTCIPA